MNFIIYSIRFVLQFGVWVVFRLCWLRGIHQTPSIELTRSRHILVLNHRSALDPVAVTGSLDLTHFVRLAPFTFMTANVFISPWYIRPIARLYGCFPAYPGMGSYGIDAAVRYLQHGYSMLMFPEGKRVRHDTPTPAKRGVRVIFEQLPDARLVLYHIEWRTALKPQFVHVGYPTRSETPESPDDIMRAVYQL